MFLDFKVVLRFFLRSNRFLLHLLQAGVMLTHAGSILPIGQLTCMEEIYPDRQAQHLHRKQQQSNNLSPRKQTSKKCLMPWAGLYNVQSRECIGWAAHTAGYLLQTHKWVPTCSTVNTRRSEVAYLRGKKKGGGGRKKLHSIYCSTLEHKKGAQIFFME